MLLFFSYKPFFSYDLIYVGLTLKLFYHSETMNMMFSVADTVKVLKHSIALDGSGLHQLFFSYLSGDSKQEGVQCFFYRLHSLGD